MPNDNDIVIYTCVTNDYDLVHPIEVSEAGETFVCFSDRPKMVPSGWIGRPFQSPSRLESGHDINRFHKMFPHRLFPEFRYSVYIDGNVSFKGGYRALVEHIRSASAAVGAFRHPEGRTVREESEACVMHKKFDSYDLARRFEQLDRYRCEGLDLSASIPANYLLVRDHRHPELSLAMSLWWSHLFEFTKRDQVSLNYALWKTGVPWVFLDKALENGCGQFYRGEHRARLWRRFVNVLGKKRRMLYRLVGRGAGRE